jgi:hypothetical protein
LTQADLRATEIASPTSALSIDANGSAALRPSDEQSEIGHPGSRGLKGHAP